jgi:hypothetical protein
VPPFLQVIHDALPARDFQRLLRRVRALGTERLRRTYQTTFWYDFGPPTNVVEQVILTLRPRLPQGRRIIGVEWWLSRMYTTDVQVDFHQDRDEKLALATGRLVHPRVSSVLFLNRVRGGALAITEELPDPDNPSLAPAGMDFALVAPRPNRLVLFDGTLTHGVLDADNQVPHGRLPGRSRLRLTLAMNWWHRRPMEVPTYAEAGLYRALAIRQPPR